MKIMARELRICYPSTLEQTDSTFMSRVILRRVRTEYELEVELCHEFIQKHAGSSFWIFRVKNF